MIDAQNQTKLIDRRPIVPLRFTDRPFADHSDVTCKVPRTFSCAVFAILFAVLLVPKAVIAQHPPSIGYLFPPAVQVGQTTDVTIGGYDWTPDMQLFVREDRVQFSLQGSPGPILVPEPPYWFGKKARRPPFGLAREVAARLTIPIEFPVGLVQWQAANANGATAIARLAVTDLPVQLDADVIGKSPLVIPACVCGQIALIGEVDRIDFVSPHDGLIACSLASVSIGSPLRAIIEIRDSLGRLVAEAADTAGDDCKLRFAAVAGESYTASVYDLDFRGDRSFVYQLTIEPQENRSPQDNSPPQAIAVGDESIPELTVPTMVTRTIPPQSNAQRFRVQGVEGELWKIAASGEKAGSTVDPVVTVSDGDGKQLARVDDIAGSTDAELEFRVPATAVYEIEVADLSGAVDQSQASYLFSIAHAAAGFALSTVDRVAIPIGGKATLQVNVVRQGGFVDPIDVKLVGLPAGVSVADNLQVPAKQNALKIDLEADPQSAAIAALVSVQGQAVVDDNTLEDATEPVLVCTTIKPPFVIDAEGQDDVTKWPRGTTFPAPVLITRDPEFRGEIVLEMTSMQGRHRQGIAGPDMRVAADVDRVLYPVFLPEWLETTRTSRMVVNGVALVPDPQGNVRYSVSKQKTRMGFLPIGAMLKISVEENEIEVGRQRRLVIPVTVHRDAMLDQPLTLMLVSQSKHPLPFTASAQTFGPDETRCDFVIEIDENAVATTEYSLTIRASLMRDGQYPVVSQADLVLLGKP